MDNETTTQKNNVSKIIILFIAIIVIISILSPFYYRYNFDRALTRGDYKEISELLKSDDFLNYATKEQGQAAVKSILASIAKNDNSSRYALLDNVGFKKFGGVSCGEKIVASMTPIILQSSNDEKIEFLGNSEVKNI